MVEYGRKIGRIEGYAKWNKGKCIENQQWQEGNWNSNQQFGAERRKKRSTRTEWRNKNSKKMRRGLGTPETTLNIPISESWGARRRRRTARNWKLIWTKNKKNFPKLAKEIDFQEVQEAQRVQRNWTQGGTRKDISYLITQDYPGWCGSVDWVPVCESKGHQFDSQSRPYPWVLGQVPHMGHMRGNQTLMFLSLSPSFPLSKNK